MSNTFNIIKSNDNSSLLVINSDSAFEINLIKKKFAFVSFGTQKHFVTIKKNPQLQKNTIMLSKNIMDKFHLPDYPRYEIKIDRNEIHIGPFIGLLLTEKDKRLTDSKLNKLMIYTKEYCKIRGAVIVFALDKIDTTNILVEGYCFNPESNYWQRGVFPYPSSIYRTVGLNDTWKHHLLSNIGDKVFNSRYFSKWEMYEWFSNDADIKGHIPYTILYSSSEEVLEILNRFKKIYIKPVSGLRGRGVVQLTQQNNGVLFKSHQKGQNFEVFQDNYSKCIHYISECFSPGKFLIQQGINLIRHNNGIIDFRCVLQKNQYNEWVCNAIIGRNGVNGSIVSNISSGGTAYYAHEILEKAISLGKENINKLIENIESLSIKVCNLLDEFGINCGTLGLDIGVDNNWDLWLIEINNRDPDPSIAMDVHDEELYHILKSSPLFYGKYLSGF